MTAMKTLMEWMLDESEVIPVDPGDVYAKAKELLAMEKEQLKNAFISGEHQQGFENEAEQFYNETYGPTTV